MITVGQTRFQMDKSGVVTIEAPQTTIVKGGGAQITVGPGPILYVPEMVKAQDAVAAGPVSTADVGQCLPFVKN